MAPGNVVVTDPEMVEYVEKLAKLWDLPKTEAAAKALRISRSRINATTKYAQAQAEKKGAKSAKKIAPKAKAPVKKAAPKAKAPAKAKAPRVRKPKADPQPALAAPAETTAQ